MNSEQYRNGGFSSSGAAVSRGSISRLEFVMVHPEEFAKKAFAFLLPEEREL